MIVLNMQQKRTSSQETEIPDRSGCHDNLNSSIILGKEQNLQ